MAQKAMTTKELTVEVLALKEGHQTMMNQMSQMMEMMSRIEANMSAPKTSKKSSKTSTTTKKQTESAFVSHLKELHNRSDEEKAAAKDEWHQFYDARWAEWKVKADQMGLKGDKRKAANKAENARLCALWREMKANK